ncbi:MAG TPA: spore coat protein [Selenomonadales bacterium]|nr:spore coat protein [Selenomonadales bacterium]
MAYRGTKYNPNRTNRLSDRDMLMDLLATGKYMSHLYDHAVLESTGGNIRDTFETLQQSEHETAQMLFSFMQQQGWYTTGANRQNFGRRLQRGQRLSGGRPAQSTQADSRYAVTSGSRDFGKYMSGRGQQPSEAPRYAGQGRSGRPYSNRQQERNL